MHAHCLRGSPTLTQSICAGAHTDADPAPDLELATEMGGWHYAAQPVYAASAGKCARMHAAHQLRDAPAHTRNARCADTRPAPELPEVKDLCARFDDAETPNDVGHGLEAASYSLEPLDEMPWPSQFRASDPGPGPHVFMSPPEQHLATLSAPAALGAVAAKHTPTALLQPVQETDNNLLLFSPPSAAMKTEHGIAVKTCDDEPITLAAVLATPIPKKTPARMIAGVPAASPRLVQVVMVLFSRPIKARAPRHNSDTRVRAQNARWRRSRGHRSNK